MQLVVLKNSIEKISSLDVDILLPGHGPFIVGKQQVDENLRHIKGFWFGMIY